jgi:hypothetical protein
MKKILVSILIFLFTCTAYAGELVSEQTQDTTPDLTDLLYFEKADNSDGLYSTLGQLLNAATDLNASGDVTDDSHNHIFSNIDATTSANWAGRFSDETGTDKFVLNDSPTFVDDITVTKIIGTAGNTIAIKIPAGYTFQVLDGSDVTIHEINTDGLINPGASLATVLFADDDAVGSAAVDEYAAKLEGNLETVGDGSEDGSLKIKIRVDGSDTLVDYAEFDGNTKVVTLGDDTAAMELDASAVTSTATLSAGVPTYTDTNGFTMSTAQAYGYVHYLTTAGQEVDLPAVAAGMQFTIESHFAGEMLIDPNGTEQIKLDGGTALTAGYRIASPGAAGDVAVCTYFSAGVWSCITNSWTDKGS